MNGHLAQWLRALGAAVLVAAVLPLSAGPVSADSSASRGAEKSDARCDDSPGNSSRGQGNGNDKECADPAETPAPTSAPTAVDAPAPAAGPSTSESATAEAKDNGKPADVAKDNGKPADVAKDNGKPADVAKDNGKPASKPSKADAPKADSPRAPATSQPSTKDNGQKPDSPKQGGHTPVNVCHATSSDSNPYVFLTVDDDSVKAEGHLEHFTDPNKFWKSAGSFGGKDHAAGDPKPDLIDGVNAVVKSPADCAGTPTTPPPPPTPVAPAGSFDTLCTATAAKAAVGPLSTGTTPGSFQLVYGATSTTVASGSVVDVPADADIELRFIPTAGAAEAFEREKSPKACPTPPPPSAELTKTSVPASGSVVTPGQTITYTVTVRNIGLVPISNEPVVDTLPQFVTVVPRSVSDNGQVGPGGRTITWLATLAPGAGETYTYKGLVVANAPTGTSLVNRVTFLLQERTTTHPVGDRSLVVTKAVSPTTAVEFGAELTYTLTVRALGTLGQTAVVVRDGIPAGTTYVGGSAACDGAGPCMESFSNNEVTWELESMAPGATRTVTFRVTVDTPRTTIQDGIAAVTIRNVGLAFSTQVPVTPSNEVVTEVVAVGGVKTGPNGGSDDGDTPVDDVDVLPNAGGSLPKTGAGIPIGALLALGGILLVAGLALLRVGWPTSPRRS